MDLPTSLSPRVLNAIKANPNTVDLSAQAPHFYELAARALELFEEDEIVDILTDTFKNRAAELANHARSSRGLIGEGGESPKGLDELEKQRKQAIGYLAYYPEGLNYIPVFRRAHESSKAAQAWLGELRKKT